MARRHGAISIAVISNGAFALSSSRNRTFPAGTVANGGLLLNNGMD